MSSSKVENCGAVVHDLSRVLVADNNLFTRNQYHTHDADGFANEVFILVNGGTGTRVVRLGGGGSGDRTIPCLTGSSDTTTPFTFIARGEFQQLLDGNDENFSHQSASSDNNIITRLNSCIVGATSKREDAVVVVAVSNRSSSGGGVADGDDDEELFQSLVQDSGNIASLHAAFPRLSYVVLGADIPEDELAQQHLLLLPPSCSSSLTVVVAPTRLVSSIYDDDSSPSAAPCRLILLQSKTSHENGKWVDCTHIVDSNSPFFPGGQMPLRCPAKRCMVEKSNAPTTTAATSNTCTQPPRQCPSHHHHQPVREVIVSGCDVGTHMDSPRHFYPNLASISHIPPSSMMGIPVIIVDVSGKCLQHEQQTTSASPTTPISDYVITVADLESAEKDVATRASSFTWEGALVMAHTGWWKLFTEAQDTKNSNIYKRGKLSKEYQITTTEMWFPGFSKEAAEWLLARNVNGIGIDTLSLDCGSSEEFPVHQIMLGAGKFQIENVNFSEVFGGGEVGHKIGVAIAAPMLVEGAFESQTRLLLQLDSNN